MKKLVCGCLGTIYYATILNSGLMSDKNRVDVTDDAIAAVTDPIMSMDTKKTGFSGYPFKKKDGGEICLCVYDRDKYELIHKLK